MVAISVRPEFLVQNFMRFGSQTPARLASFLLPSSDGIDSCVLQLTPLMFDVIGRLLNIPFSGLVSVLYVDALALELLCAAIGNFETLPDRATEEYPVSSSFYDHSLRLYESLGAELNFNIMLSQRSLVLSHSEHELSSRAAGAIRSG